LIDDKLQLTSIKSIKTIKAPTTCVYNLCTAEPHTYFANRIAVHNKLGKTFVNLSKDKDPKRIKWSLDGPNWRIARPGICLEGRCINESCPADKQLVVINVGIRKFDLLVDSARTSRCPECTRYVEPITCAFNNCCWRWEGQIQSADGVEPTVLSGNWKPADNAYHRFEENVNGLVTWLQLILEAKSK
ncbi:unnamed protein product, partial [Rotaria sp. Silwood2]